MRAITSYKSRRSGGAGNGALLTGMTGLCFFSSDPDFGRRVEQSFSSFCTL